MCVVSLLSEKYTSPFLLRHIPPIYSDCLSWVVPGVERASRSWVGVLVSYKGYFCLSGMGPLLNVALLLTIYLILALTLNLLKTKRDEKRGPHKSAQRQNLSPKTHTEQAHSSLFQARDYLKRFSEVEGFPHGDQVLSIYDHS